MKQNAEQQVDEVADQSPDLHVVEAPGRGNGAKNLPLPSTRQSRQSRPEIAVLGWKARFYRLSLRTSKA
jgi:hypothetical protein